MTFTLLRRCLLMSTSYGPPQMFRLPLHQMFQPSIKYRSDKIIVDAFRPHKTLLLQRHLHTAAMLPRLLEVSLARTLSHHREEPRIHFFSPSRAIWRFLAMSLSVFPAIDNQMPAIRRTFFEDYLFDIRQRMSRPRHSSVRNIPAVLL